MKRHLREWINRRTGKLADENAQLLRRVAELETELRRRALLQRVAHRIVDLVERQGEFRIELLPTSRYGPYEMRFEVGTRDARYGFVALKDGRAPERAENVANQMAHAIAHLHDCVIGIQEVPR